MEFEYTPDDRNKSCKIANGSPSDFQRRENSAGRSQLSWTASVAAYLRKSSECWFRTVHLENILGPVDWNHGVIFHVFSGLNTSGVGPITILGPKTTMNCQLQGTQNRWCTNHHQLNAWPLTVEHVRVDQKGPSIDVCWLYHPPTKSHVSYVAKIQCLVLEWLMKSETNCM